METGKYINDLLSGYQKSLIILTANQHKIFDHLEGNPSSAEDISNVLKLSLKGVERLLNALCGLELLQKRGSLYQLPANMAYYLTSAGENSMTQWMRLSSDLFPIWNQLPDFVQNGKMVKRIMDVLGTDPERMENFTDSMHEKAIKATEMLANELPLEDARSMLDIGGGPGTYALEWAKKHPDLKATVMDIPPVLEITKKYIKKYGLEDQVITRPGDIGKDSFGEGYDLVLLANILHMYDADWAQTTLKKAIAALKPGGRVVVHGFCTDEALTGPLEDVIFSLNIGLLTEGGNAHPVAEEIRWLEENGIQKIRHFRVTAIPTGVVTGLKAS
jgi:SAM-dependent methyltransferase